MKFKIGDYFCLEKTTTQQYKVLEVVESDYIVNRCNSNGVVLHDTKLHMNISTIDFACVLSPFTLQNKMEKVLDEI